MKRITVPKSEYGTPLHLFLQKQGVNFPLPCGGNGTCGKCKVTVINGDFPDKNNPEKMLIPDKNGCIHACRALCPEEGGIIEFNEVFGSGVTDYENGQTSNKSTDIHTSYGLAVDIGTTTVAFSLIDTESGVTLEKIACLNPQQIFGADVITRIEQAQKGLLPDMTNCIREIMKKTVLNLCRKHGIDSKTLSLAVVGNPTMLHIFLGISPLGMATYPFTPEFLETKKVNGNDINLPCGTVTVLPSAAPFIGSDITAGLVATETANLFLSGSQKNILFLDIGTNGEAVLLSRNKLFASSAAAGPALEGGNISSGMGGVNGAVNRVYRDKESGGICFETIGNEMPKGLCSSGLFDLIALLRKENTVDETGLLKADPYPLTGFFVTEGKKQFLRTDITLTGKDIREFQLAKSAIRAEIDILLHEANITEDDIDCVLTAGGIGYYLDLNSAVTAGLFSEKIKEKAVPVGNSALKGAELYLCKKVPLTLYTTVSEKMKVFELNNSPLFSQKFIDNMTL